MTQALFKPYYQDQPFLLPPSIEEMIPDTYIVRIVNTIIEKMDKGKIGEDNTTLLGAMLTTKLELATLSRADTPEQERKDFYLYADEFPNYVTESFSTILSDAHKYKLSLTLVNQLLEAND